MCKHAALQTIASDKRGNSHNIFSYLSIKTYVVGTHCKFFGEALLMSTHSVCFCGEIRKNMSTIWLKKVLELEL